MTVPLASSCHKGRFPAVRWVGDAIDAIGDWLGSIFGIMSGVSGATLGSKSPPGRAGALRLLSPLRGLIATETSKSLSSTSSDGTLSARVRH